MRRLVAALACRNNGSRLFGKPMQNLLGHTTILDQIICALKQSAVIDEIVIGISEGAANQPFVEVAHQHGLSYIFGDPKDVLMRLIQCGRAGKATDVFRTTTECPWSAYDMIEPLWRRHVEGDSDLTTTDRLPEGLGFEIFTQEALERSHERGAPEDRSELCSRYVRIHRDEFRIDVVLPPKDLQRMDLRVTVDYPEDLYLCREIARACADTMPLVPTRRIIDFIDSRPDLHKLVAPHVVAKPMWD
jgi:spore coat polysaccharide biosynthesis protein SpsF